MSQLHCTDPCVADQLACLIQLSCLQDGSHYLIFDCPGQVELFSMHTGMKTVIDSISNAWHIRCECKQSSGSACVHLCCTLLQV